jgi:hypothetical protein
MTGIDADSEFAADDLERRWFASMSAARAKQAECEALLEVMAMVKASWHDSRAELAKLEALRDALAGAVDGMVAERRALRELFAAAPAGDRVSSAA